MDKDNYIMDWIKCRECGSVHLAFYPVYTNRRKLECAECGVQDSVRLWKIFRRGKTYDVLEENVS